MTSQSSGYITMSRNRSENDAGPWCKTVSVPARHVVMTSYKKLTPFWTPVNLLCCFRNPDPSVGLSRQTVQRHLVWESNSDWSHVSHLYYFNDTNFVIRVVGFFKNFDDTCPRRTNSTCFQFFFSLFPENKAPKMLVSGFWNCSEEHYSSFQHHVDCNLKTECEDGRDETEHCPFSSADCHSLLALCGRCYKFLTTLRGLEGDKTNGNERINNHCKSFGGTLRLPMCLYDLQAVIANRSKRYLELGYFWNGLYSNDLSLPNIYRHSLYSEDRTVFHTYFKRHDFETGEHVCTVIFLKNMVIRNKKCALSDLDTGAVCEVRINKTEMSSPDPKQLSLANIGSSLPKGTHTMTVCIDSHITHSFLLCGSNQDKLCNHEYTSPCRFSGQTSYMDMPDSIDIPVALTPTLTCNDELATVSYTLVCDFIPDCQDSSDEFFCKHLVCDSTFFTCTNGHCLPYDNVCDQMSHCHDESDERNCYSFTWELIKVTKRFPFPALVDFNGISQFTAIQMSYNESCPDSHYLCPGEFNDCLPVYTRCNGMYDCRERDDEGGCDDDIKCPGFYQCRFSKLCLHSDHLCDGWAHCPKHDDELWCNAACAASCVCQGHSFLCLKPFRAALFPQIRSLDATGLGMTLSDVSSNAYLILLVLANNSLTLLPKMKLLNLRFLDLSCNNLQHINMTAFLRLENLQSLSLSGNPVSSLQSDSSPAIQSALAMIDMSHTTLTVFDSKVLAQFARLQKVNLTFTSIHTISRGGFQYISELTELYLDGSHVKMFPLDIFEGLPHLSFISTPNYKLCCNEILPSNFDASFCHAPRDEISSCEDLLQSCAYRGFLWLITCLTVSGNLFCLCARFFAKSMASAAGFGVFVTNLTMADFLMGVYMTAVGVADERFRGRYFRYDDTWKSSVACKVAGFLSLLSSEVSALIICLITVDRFIVLCFPFTTLRFERTSAAVACVLIWLVGWFLAVLPLLPMTSHWEFYSQTGICIPLPVTRQEFKGKVYSFSILIVLNFVLFLFISLGQAFIYWTIQSNALKTSSTKVSQDMIIARRLITIALTDFMCWFPIGLCGIMALTGIPIPGEVNVALAIFVLPLNSAINPFMYTFNTLAEKRRKSKESKLLKWMESHADFMSS